MSTDASVPKDDLPPAVCIAEFRKQKQATEEEKRETDEKPDLREYFCW